MIESVLTDEGKAQIRDRAHATIRALLEAVRAADIEGPYSCRASLVRALVELRDAMEITDKAIEAEMSMWKEGNGARSDEGRAAAVALAPWT